MICLLQRVLKSEVQVDEKIAATINNGLMVLVGVEKTDDNATADRMLEKLLNYRVFSDENDKMNLSLIDVQGGLLLVPQFTLAANTNKGRRPSFASAAPPQLGRQLFEYFLHQAKDRYGNVQAGIFGADMQVSLVNDGPVTFWLQL